MMRLRRHQDEAELKPATLTVDLADPAKALAGLDVRSPDYATQAVDVMLRSGRAAGASDLHLLPSSTGMQWQWRLDGVLHTIFNFPPGISANIVARLKVLADLLTYRTDTPQEGRIRAEGTGIEMRLSTFPTLHGEKAVVRLFATSAYEQPLDELHLPAEITRTLHQLTGETSGVIVLTGPAGSGKTTTAYACLREIVRREQGSRSIASLEDPVELEIQGVAQSQVNPTVGLDLATGLRFLLRQDPQVILLGEVRDAETATTAFQAGLTGHLVITTFHAGTAAEAVSRLVDMRIEPYVLASGLRTVICQRLVRRLCECSRESREAADRLGLEVAVVRVPVGCAACRHTGYRGRLPLAEMLGGGTRLDRQWFKAWDSPELQQRAEAAGMVSLTHRAKAAVEAGWTSPAEVRRVLGFF